MTRESFGKVTFETGLRYTVAVRNRITHINFPREIYVRGCLQPTARLFGILIQPVQEKFPLPIKLERTGISADTRDTTPTKMAQVHGFDWKIIVLWSSRIYLRLVHSLIFSVDTFSRWFTNMLNLEIFFGFMVLLSVALLDRGKLSCTSK